jgi:hypothetical protein
VLGWWELRHLLIDKLSNYCIPKDGVLLPRMGSYSSVLPLIVDPFIIKGCNYYELRRSILIIEAAAGHGDCTSQQGGPVYQYKESYRYLHTKNGDAADLYRNRDSIGINHAGIGRYNCTR